MQSSELTIMKFISVIGHEKWWVKLKSYELTKIYGQQEDLLTLLWLMAATWRSGTTQGLSTPGIGANIPCRHAIEVAYFVHRMPTRSVVGFLIWTFQRFTTRCTVFENSASMISASQRVTHIASAAMYGFFWWVIDTYSAFGAMKCRSLIPDLAYATEVPSKSLRTIAAFSWWTRYSL